jgi:hypothetical protein
VHQPHQTAGDRDLEPLRQPARPRVVLPPLAQLRGDALQHRLVAGQRRSTRRLTLDDAELGSRFLGHDHLQEDLETG